MERSEPSFVPEWLKGGSGVCSSLTAYQSEPQTYQDESGGSRQRSQLQTSISGSRVDFDSPRYLTSDRLFHPLPRRVLDINGSSNERSTFDRDALSQPRPHSSYGRIAPYRSQDGQDRERAGLKGDRGLDRDWEWEQLRERERDKMTGFANGDERDREREQPDESVHGRHNTVTPVRYDLDFSFKRSLSLGSSSRILENGMLKQVAESSSLLGGSSVGSGNLSSNIQKAAFERNFPSLGSQERTNNPQSSLGDISGLSVRPFRQMNGGRASSPGLASAGSAAVSGLVANECWNSVLAEVPNSSGSFLSSNGMSTASSSKAMMGTTPVSTSGNLQQTAPKMAEALLQNPPRVRTPPQPTTETQRLEELALKQSRQLIPIKPSLPKAQGLSPRDKPKPKIGRGSDNTTSSSTKLSQPKVSSQPSSPLYWSSLPTRPDATKLSPGMLVVQKTSKEAPGSSQLSGKLDTSSVAPLSTFSSIGGIVTAGSSSAPNSGVIVTRKPKHLLDRRSVPVTPLSVIHDAGAAPRLRDGVPGTEDKRPSPAQNRSDFFNALRKKAAINGAASDNAETLNSTLMQKSEELSVNEEFSEGNHSVLEGGFKTPVPKLEKIQELVSMDASGCISDGIVGDKMCRENFVNDKLPEFTKCLLEKAPISGSSDSAMTRFFVGYGSEEEEAAFMRSLGWNENSEEGEEALTEEEIDAFLKEHMVAITSRPLLNQCRLRFKNVGVAVHTEKVGCILSGHSSLDCKSDNEPYSKHLSFPSSGIKRPMSDQQQVP